MDGCDCCWDLTTGSRRWGEQKVGQAGQAVVEVGSRGEKAGAGSRHLAGSGTASRGC